MDLDEKLVGGDHRFPPKNSGCTYNNQAQYFPNRSMYIIHLESVKEADFIPGGMGRGQRFCIPKKFSGLWSTYL
jgi:hypothetical protein